MVLYYFIRCLGLLLFGLLVYAQTFQFDFVFDDRVFIVANPFIKNFSNFHLMWHAFPLTRWVGMSSFAINYHFNQLNPQGYHIFNFIVHLVATGLVWALADLLFKITDHLPLKDHLRQKLPFIIAVLFLVHPCQTQAVTYITQRFESMATVFYLGTIYMYLRARLATDRGHKIALGGLAGFLGILGIMTKEVIITLPVMILALEWILFPKKGKNNLHVIFLVVGILLCPVFFKLAHAHLIGFFEVYHSESHDGETFIWTQYLLTQMRVFLTFLRILIFPIHQNLDYDYPISTGLLHPPLTLLGLLVVLGFIYSIVKLRRQFPLISFGLAWMLITFSVNLVPRTNVIFEHKLYLISFGFFLAFVEVLSRWIKDRRTLLKIFSCLVIVLTVTSFQRNKVWANELILWEDIIKKSPDKARVNANLGRVYGTLGRYDEAIHYLSRAIVLSPDVITYANRGIIYVQQGRSPQALEDLNKALALDPNYYPAYVKRSWVYQKQYDYKAALSDLAMAIGLEPDFADAYVERGLLFVEIGQYGQALSDFEKASKIEPLNMEIAKSKSYCLRKLGR